MLRVLQPTWHNWPRHNTTLLKLALCAYFGVPYDDDDTPALVQFLIVHSSQYLRQNYIAQQWLFQNYPDE